MKTSLSLLIALLVPTFVTAQGATPQQIADELLAADRAFAAAGANTDLISGISAMFATDVAMPAPGGIAYGSQKAIEALKANPANAGAKVQWTPARVGISGDRRHGFTAGFMTIQRADGSSAIGKYLAYWEKQPGPANRSSGASPSEGWRVLDYKRTPAKTPPPAIPMARITPKAIVSSIADRATIERHRKSLAEAERAFSRDAQTMGIGPAFKQYGSPDAINLGGPDTPGFSIGNEQIAAGVGGNSPPNTSPVNWGPEKTIIAASGDFGVTIGYIVSNTPEPGPSTGSGQGGKIPPGQPFFTIWRRNSVNEKWLYIAE